MVQLTRKNFEINNSKYFVEINSRMNHDGYTLVFEILFKDTISDRTIFQTICGDWGSAKDVVDICFSKMGEMLNVDPDTIERARDGFLKN